MLPTHAKKHLLHKVDVLLLEEDPYLVFLHEKNVDDNKYTQYGL